MERTTTLGGWVREIMRRCDDVTGFVVLPKRWMVERTFGWIGRYRRMSQDYEMLTASSETMIFIVMINVMLYRLAPGMKGLLTHLLSSPALCPARPPW